MTWHHNKGLIGDAAISRHLRHDGGRKRQTTQARHLARKGTTVLHMFRSRLVSEVRGV